MGNASFFIREEMLADCESIACLMRAAFARYPRSRHNEQNIVNALQTAGCCEFRWQRCWLENG
jgi:predicted N-acetyltransferase YhbS